MATDWHARSPPRGQIRGRGSSSRGEHSPLETHAVGGPGRNLPRSLRTGPRPVPNFGANGRGKRPSARDAIAKQPADAAAADAIDAVRAVADVSVQAIRRRRTDAVVEMDMLTNTALPPHPAFCEPLLFIL